MISIKERKTAVSHLIKLFTERHIQIFLLLGLVYVTLDLIYYIIYYFKDCHMEYLLSATNNKPSFTIYYVIIMYYTSAVLL